MNITRPPLRLHVLLAFLLNTLSTVTTSSTATLRTSNITLELPDEQRLLMKLLKNYDSNVRPAMNSSVSVEVTFGFSLIQIMDMVSEIGKLSQCDYVIATFGFSLIQIMDMVSEIVKLSQCDCVIGFFHSDLELEHYFKQYKQQI